MSTGARAADIAGALRQARAAGVDRLDAQLLLAHLLNRPRAWLIAHDDAALEPAVAGGYAALLARRAAGEPLAYLVGSKDFHGLSLKVDANVLVPRPDTELLVDWALELLREAFPALAHPAVVDLGTGSGAIALAVKHGHPAACVTATDASAGALGAARANAERLGLAVEFALGSWWQALGTRRFELALSNPPYIAAHDPHLAALVHEPMLALSPGGDGLDALRALVADAPDHLAPGGRLLLEHGHDQAGAVRDLLVARGFTAIGTRRDLAGHERCTGGRRPDTSARGP